MRLSAMRLLLGSRICWGTSPFWNGHSIRLLSSVWPVQRYDLVVGSTKHVNCLSAKSCLRVSCSTEQKTCWLLFRLSRRLVSETLTSEKFFSLVFTHWPKHSN